MVLILSPLSIVFYQLRYYRWWSNHYFQTFIIFMVNIFFIFSHQSIPFLNPLFGVGYSFQEGSYALGILCLSGFATYFRLRYSLLAAIWAHVLWNAGQILFVLLESNFGNEDFTTQWIFIYCALLLVSFYGLIYTVKKQPNVRLQSSMLD